MGKSLFILVAATALGVSFVQFGKGDAASRSRTDSALDQQYVLAERGATGALDAAVSRATREFSTWRAGYPETQAGELSFEVEAEGPAAGPIRLAASGDHRGAAHRVESVLTRLVDSDAALVLDADTAAVTFWSNQWLVSGRDAQARTWLDASTPTEGHGYGADAVAVRTRTATLRAAVLDAVPSGHLDRLRGRSSSSDVETVESPELSSLAGDAEAAATHVHAGGLIATSGTRFGSASSPVIVHSDGDFRSPVGSVVGYGVLLVDGDFVVGGEFEWNGLVIVRTEGASSVSLSDRAAVYGALYVLHESGYTLGNGFYPYKSIWAIDDVNGRLLYFYVEEGAVTAKVEGDLVGMTFASSGDRVDVEGLAFMPDGMMYLVNNRGSDRDLYRISPTQFDNDPTTPVQVTLVGPTGGDDDTQVTGLVVKDGVLYGLGRRSQDVYRIDTATGTPTSIRSFSVPVSDFVAGGLSLGPSGKVYANRLEGGNGGDLELWRFDSFPLGDPVYVGELGPRPPTTSSMGAPMAVAPDGTVFLTDRTEIRESTVNGGLESILDFILDIDAMEMFWEGEGGSSSGSGTSSYGGLEFEMAQRAQIVHSAEAIGQLANLLSALEGESYVVERDRFGRDLPRPLSGATQ